jgi:hypothetical protein
LGVAEQVTGEHLEGAVVVLQPYLHFISLRINLLHIAIFKK